MEKCSKCGADTILFEDGVPICVRCSDDSDKKDDSPEKDQRIRAVLLQELLETSQLVQSASVESDASVPEGGSLNIARKAMAQAHNRLNDYLGRGIVPEELKRSG
jgi:hypothetical protein